MTKNVSKLIVAAMVSGLIAGSVAHADDTPAAGGDAPAKSKDSCKGKNGCKGKGKCKGHHKNKAKDGGDAAPKGDAKGDAGAPPANPQ
jgi:hypothetical protein